MKVSECKFILIKIGYLYFCKHLLIFKYLLVVQNIDFNYFSMKFNPPSYLEQGYDSNLTIIRQKCLKIFILNTKYLISCVIKLILTF